MPHSKDTGTVVRLAARGLPHVAGPADRGPEKPLTVLVIDDSPEDRMILRFALEASGFVLLEAGSGRNGIVQVSAQTPDCILLDHRLPDIEGLDVLEQLRRPDGQLPCAVVMLTGSDDAAVATAAMKAGALDFIVKDHLHHDSLRRAIRNAMYQFRLAAEHRQAEQRNAHLAAIVSASGDAIVSLEADGARVRSWSPGATQVFGYSEAEAIGRSIDELIVPEHLEEERPQLFAALRSGRQAIVIDTVRRHKSGHLIPVEINASPMLDSGGGIMGYSVIFRDVSERRRAEARFAAIRQALSGGADGEQGAPVAETRSLGLPGDRSAARIMAAHSAALFDAPREWAFDQITQLASCMLQAPVSLLTVIDARRQFFVSAHGLPRPLDTARETPLGLSYCRYVVESGAPVAITDASCNPLVSAIGAWQQGFVSYLGVPVFDHTGEVIASLSVGDATPRAWTRQDRSMLEGIARLLTRELENRAMLRERRRNEEALRLQSERLTLLLDVTSALVGRSLDQAALGRIVFERIGAALQADSCFNYRLDPNSGGLELVFASGVPADRLETVQRIEFGQAFCGTVAETSEGILADAQRIATDPKAEFVAGLGIRAYACHPIRASDGRLLGTFALASTTRESYAAEDGALLQTVTNVLGQAWDRIAHERRCGRARRACASSATACPTARSRPVAFPLHQRRRRAPERHERRERARRCRHSARPDPTGASRAFPRGGRPQRARARRFRDRSADAADRRRAPLDAPQGAASAVARWRHAVERRADRHHRAQAERGGAARERAPPAARDGGCGDGPVGLGHRQQRRAVVARVLRDPRPARRRVR